MTEATMTESTSDTADDRYMTTEEISETYAERADWFDRLDPLDRLLTGRYRRRLFATATGRVLDVACGTGVNFPYVPRSSDIVGIDASPAMLSKARGRLAELNRDGDLFEMDAQDLAFADEEFDTVISSLSTCTFPDPVAAVREMDRVCKPDGKILLLEHGRSDVETIGRVQDWRAPSHYESMGCRLNQTPMEHVRAADLRVLDVRTALAGIVTAIEAEPSQS
jgi:ubiquinone/menaquinone biosynthesis C-methylase UbiE